MALYPPLPTAETQARSGKNALDSTGIKAYCGFSIFHSSHKMLRRNGNLRLSCFADTLFHSHPAAGFAKIHAGNICLTFSVSRWEHPDKSLFDLWCTMSISFIFMFAFLWGAISPPPGRRCSNLTPDFAEMGPLCALKIPRWPAFYSTTNLNIFMTLTFQKNPIYLPLHLCNETQHLCNIHAVVVVSSFFCPFSLFAVAECTSCIKWVIFTMGQFIL